MSESKSLNLGRVTGKSAFEHAVEGGYTGSETEFNEKLGKDIDNAPVAGSDNLITSGAVASALNNIASVHIGTSAPINLQTLWIDTSTVPVLKFYDGSKWAAVVGVWGD